MGILDRDYLQPERHGRYPGAHLSVVQWLIIVNVAVFFLDSLLQGSSRGNALAPVYWGYFSFAKGIAGLELWRLFTYQFLHANLLHLLFNMIALHYFGPFMESFFGRRGFLYFYLLCGVAGAIVMSLLTFVPGLDIAGPDSALVGASGAIYGVLVGTAMKYPDLPVRLLLPPVEMRMRTLVLVYLGIILLSLLVGSANAGGEACHLGGALLGFLLVRNPQLLTAMSFPRVTRIQRPGGTKIVSRGDIDRILDKISRDGIHSLNAREKEILEQARKDILR